MLDKCRQNGDFATGNFCGAAAVGTSDTIELHVTQSRTTLLGTIDLGGYSSDLNGTVADNGTITHRNDPRR